MAGKLCRERPLAVGGEDHVRHLLAHRHGIDQRDLAARDAQHADRVVGAIRDQGQVARPVDRQARGLLADLEGIDQPRRRCREVNHVQPVVRRRLPARPILHPVHRICDQRQLLVRRDGQVHRRAEDRVHQRQAGEDPGRERIGADVDDRHRVLARRQEKLLAGGVPADLLVVADDHQLALAGCCVHAGAACERRAEGRNDRE